jgi:hypothetical protein
MRLFLCFTLLSFAFSQILYSIVGLITETSFQLKAKSSDGLALKVLLNNQIIQTLNPVSDNGYYYEFDYNSLTNNTSYVLDLEYAGTIQTQQKKIFKTPNYGNTNYTFGILSSQSKIEDSLAYFRLSNRITDAIMFLGGISDDYYDEITESELQVMYEEGKKILKL